MCVSAKRNTKIYHFANTNVFNFQAPVDKVSGQFEASFMNNHKVVKSIKITAQATDQNELVTLSDVNAFICGPRQEHSK